MSRPTDAELNRAMAEACGWKDIQDHAYTPSGIAVCGTVPDDRPSPWNNGRHYIRRYCADRNALPEILDTIGEAAKATVFCRLITDGCGTMEGAAWNALNTTMRDIVEAALRALSAWKPEWDAPE